MTECVNKSKLVCRMGCSMSVMVLAISVLSAAEIASVDSQQLNRILSLKTAMQVSRFPVGFWNYADLERHGEHFDQEEVKSWADAGFTVTQSPGFNAQNSRHIAHIRSLLEWASVYNLKLIVNDPRVYNPAPDAEEIIKGGIEAYRQSITAAVDDFSGLNALFGFHIGDEPQGDWNRSYVEAYKILKDIAPNLHPFMNLLPYQNTLHLVGFKSWPQYLDTIASEANAEFLCYDCYAQMNGDLDTYFENLRLFREAGWRNGVPFWTTLLSVPHFHYQVRSYDDLRWQFNTSVCSGASGILWFFYYMRHPHDNYRLSPVDEHWEKTQLYFDLKRLHNSFHRLYGDLFNRLAVTKVMFYGKAFGGGELFKPNGTVKNLSTDRPNHSLLLSEFQDKQGNAYIMLVNNSMTDSVKAAITFAGSHTKVFARNWYGGEYEGKACADGVFGPAVLEDGIQFDHWLAPGQEIFYRIEKKL